MAKLRKYQVESLRREVKNKLQEKADELKESDEFNETYTNILEEFELEYDMERYKELVQKRKQLKQEINDIESAVKQINNRAKEDIKSISFSTYSYRSCLYEELEKEAERRAYEKMELSIPSNTEIEDAIILADFSDTEEIVEAVIERLS